MRAAEALLNIPLRLVLAALLGGGTLAIAQDAPPSVEPAPRVEPPADVADAAPAAPATADVLQHDGVEQATVVGAEVPAATAPEGGDPEAPLPFADSPPPISDALSGAAGLAVPPAAAESATPAGAAPQRDASTTPLSTPPAAIAEPLAGDTPPSVPPAVGETSATTLAPAPSAAPEVGPPRLLPEADPASTAFIGPPLVPPMKLLQEEVAPGSKRQLAWVAGQSFAGGESVAPVNVVRGTRPGPVLCLTAAIHGDELNGVEIVRRIFNDLDPDRLSGTVIAVPIVNMFGFSRNSRYLPDRRDLNRFFPGSQRGSIASRIAHGFFHDVARHCDYLVDFHTGSFERDNLPQVRADLRLPEVLRFSRGFGALPVLHSDGTRGMLRVAATQIGIPSVTFEVGAPGVLQVAQIDAAAVAIDALMHHLGMVPDAPPPQEPQAIFYESQWVRANAGGLLISQVGLGESVEPGQMLGVVVDPVRNLERRIESPIHGRVIGMARNQVVLPGFAAFHIGEATSAERASDAAAAGEVIEEVEEDPDPAMEREAM